MKFVVLTPGAQPEKDWGYVCDTEGRLVKACFRKDADLRNKSCRSGLDDTHIVCLSYSHDKKTILSDKAASRQS